MFFLNRHSKTRPPQTRTVPRRATNTQRRPARRGVLLLIVLSLLVLFVLIGVTFVVVAGQYTRAAKAYAKHEQKGDRPQQELDDALMMLLRGSTDVNNPLYSHSLLEDLYGTDGFKGRVIATLQAGLPIGLRSLAVYAVFGFKTSVRRLDRPPTTIAAACSP